MIYDSSKNYLDGWVTIVYDDVDPTPEEINTYCEQNYGFTPGSFYIDSPNQGYGGFSNPGIVKCHPVKDFV